MCSLLQCSTALQLECVQKLVPIILPSMVSLLNQLIRAYDENADKDSETSDNESSVINSDDELDPEKASKSIVSDEEDVLDDDTDVKELKHNLQLAGFGEEEYSSESSETEGETLEKTELESEYETLVDVERDYDEFVTFKVLMESVSIHNPQLYVLLTSQVDLILCFAHSLFVLPESIGCLMQSLKLTVDED